VRGLGTSANGLYFFAGDPAAIATGCSRKS
jgi:hypothetical protein